MAVQQENTKFEGWLGLGPEAVNGSMQWGEFEPKKWTEDDVDIKIECCGVCGSDLGALKSAWGPVPYPCVVGHEIVGKAVRVGNNVKHVKVGDRVGLGAQSGSCLECGECSSGQESYCANSVGTYVSAYPNDEGKSYGGYATRNRTKGHFVVPIPEGLDSAVAAPLLCAGVTVYAPLKRHGCGPGKTVGIVGVGGLGHFAILFARALGADKIVALSRKADKREDALRAGADEYIATEEDSEWSAKKKRSLDIIIGTASSSSMPMAAYLTMLKVGGTYVQLGLPDGGSMPGMNAWIVTANRLNVTGSFVGSPGDIREMLELAKDTKMQPMIEKRPLQEANQVLLDMAKGKARYRYVLVHENS